MATLFDTLSEQLQGQAIDQITKQFGIDRSGAQNAMPGALSALLGALAGNAKTSAGASALGAALDRDHDGSLLDNLGGFLSQGSSSVSAGEAILGHVLGGKRGQVENQLSQSSGLDSQAVGKMLATLAPIVLSALGKAKRSNGLDNSGLASMLEQERSGLQQKAPSDFGALASLLDADGDGDIKDDLGRMGSSLLKKFLK